MPSSSSQEITVKLPVSGTEGHWASAPPTPVGTRGQCWPPDHSPEVLKAHSTKKEQNEDVSFWTATWQTWQHSVGWWGEEIEMEPSVLVHREMGGCASKAQRSVWLKDQRKKKKKKCWCFLQSNCGQADVEVQFQMMFTRMNTSNRQCPLEKSSQSQKKLEGLSAAAMPRLVPRARRS